MYYVNNSTSPAGRFSHAGNNRFRQDAATPVQSFKITEQNPQHHPGCNNYSKIYGPEPHPKRKHPPCEPAGCDLQYCVPERALTNAEILRLQSAACLFKSLGCFEQALANLMLCEVRKADYCRCQNYDHPLLINQETLTHIIESQMILVNNLQAARQILQKIICNDD